jgi:hypothetical protein
LLNNTVSQTPLSSTSFSPASFDTDPYNAGTDRKSIG